jgi:poly(3-hydroxybutyrate) depolymerase
VRWTEGRGCPPEITVRLAVVPGLGHVWPGGPRLLPQAIVGPASPIFPATAAIRDFFSGLRPGPSL